MLIGDTLTEPRVKDGRSSAGGLSLPSHFSSDLPSARVTPIAAAVLTTLHRPTLRSSMPK